MPNKVPAEVAREREARAWELKQQLWTDERIAAELGVDRSTVTKALQRVERRVLAHLEDSISQLKVRQTAQLEYLAAEAVSAWEASKRPAETTRTVIERAETPADDDARAGEARKPEVIVKTTLTVKGQSGDPRFLNAAREALADVRKLWGLDAPQRIELTKDAGSQLPDKLEEAFRRIYGYDRKANPTPIEGPEP